MVARAYIGLDRTRVRLQPSSMDSDPDHWHSVPPTANATVTWQPAPSYRSTSNILISCLYTLFICVWSALHVDIPTPGTKWWQWRRHRSKLGWVFVGLFCPELLFFIAFKQFKMALLLTIKAHDYLPIADDMKEGAQHPKLPRFYGLLDKMLGKLTDEETNSGTRDVESSGDEATREHASTAESSPGLDSLESRSNAIPLSALPRASAAESPPLQQSPCVSEFELPLLRAGSSASPCPVHQPPGPVPGSPHPSPVSKPVRRHRWTLAHGFYAAMGGFVLKEPYVPPSSDHYLPAWQKNGVLTPAGVLLLMKVEPSLIPDLAHDDIVSFGKADAIAKALLILQVSWFLITCIIRHAQGLPLCLFEITTIAHAACTLLTYVMWWAKPKDIEHQTVIVGSAARALGAWMSMASPADRYAVGGFLSQSLDSEMYATPRGGFNCKGGRVSFHRGRSSPSRWKVRFVFAETTIPWYLDQAPEQPPTETDAKQARWTLAYQAMEKYPDSLPAKLDGTRYVTPTASLQAYLDSGDYDAARYSLTHFFVVALLMGAVYGLPHLIGVTVTFASATERTLWLVATVLVATMGVGLFGSLCVLALSFALWDYWQMCLTGLDPPVSERWFPRLEESIYVVIPILYVCSSGFLVGESIRQLFALPPAAFDLPSYGRYWPHFS
ncbi:hypothetical protein K466DRAFT_532156 [Polyporus arcularius HHB13444]|uniref:Uncharacterized protein n=1 Tax=Polyporus arcularius HHB13444 TaxID=1314778 RepID=A0A5C3NV13_9APHY|nr:hypothetical protein K466DRAFT_532156 [Polyporus arcularius HHB13444]